MTTGMIIIAMRISFSRWLDQFIYLLFLVRWRDHLILRIHIPDLQGQIPQECPFNLIQLSYVYIAPIHNKSLMTHDNL